MKALRTLLAHPLTRRLDIDDPRTTHARRQIISGNPFLHQIYLEWYQMISQALPGGSEPVLEIGSGAGFMQDMIPGIISSEVFRCPEIHTILDGQRLPFSAGSLRGVVMTNVLHHLPAPRRFFQEASRCVCSKGRLVMVEPWVTGWSKFIYRNFHHEPFLPGAVEWELEVGGALSNANGALPWIIFKRDRRIFEQEFTDWHIHSIQPMMPFRYLLSGGVSMRKLVPGFMFSITRGIEKLVQPWMNYLGIFALIILERR